MAFTLSETLIALVVIGIIAAITVPNIVAHQREVATVEKVKKFYSTISNAVKRAIVDTGLNVDEWDNANSDSRATSIKFMSYLKPYLIISVDDCGKDSNSPCYGNITIKKLNGNVNNNFYNTNAYYKVILNDGSIFALRTWYGADSHCKSNICAYIQYDINGLKPPNTIAKDIFEFRVYKDKVVPSETNDCGKDKEGWGCAAYILKNGNMDYLH